MGLKKKTRAGRTGWEKIDRKRSCTLAVDCSVRITSDSVHTVSKLFVGCGAEAVRGTVLTMDLRILNSVGRPSEYCTEF